MPDQTDPRDRIAAALRPHASLGGTPPRYELPFFDGATPGLPRISGWKPLDDVAADVAAVLPRPADRAAVLADVDSAIRAATGNCGYKAGDGCDFCNGVDAALDQVRRMAAEAQQPEAPCCADPTCACDEVNAAGRCDCARWDSDPQALTVRYRNHRGETADRTIIPMRIWYGATEWHPEDQWLLEALDVARNVVRDFAIADIQAWPLQRVLAAVRDSAKEERRG